MDETKVVLVNGTGLIVEETFKAVQGALTGAGARFTRARTLAKNNRHLRLLPRSGLHRALHAAQPEPLATERLGLSLLDGAGL